MDKYKYMVSKIVDLGVFVMYHSFGEKLMLQDHESKNQVLLQYSMQC